MFSISWFYLYGVGGLIYVVGTVLCARNGVLDFAVPGERRVYIGLTGALILFAAVHGLFQFVFPFIP